MNEFKLCYVDGSWAWFTTKDVKEQWGDDWNDAPYEHNAGDPYSWAEYMDEPKYELMRVAWEGPFSEPKDGHFNSPYCVQDINDGDFPWLRTDEWSDAHLEIFAGTDFPTFVKLIQKGGGNVYVAMENPPAETWEALWREKEQREGLL